MSQNTSILVLTVIIIAAGFYIMYGKPFSPKQVDLTSYQSLCDQYRAADKGTYKQEEIQMLISEINYLITEDMKEIKDPVSRELKKCSQDLSNKLNEK